MSRYANLSTIYGNTEREQNRVRTYKNGLIFPDSVASERIMMMPPGVVAMAIMFSRNHNQIAEGFLSVNEAGKCKSWDTLTGEQKDGESEARLNRRETTLITNETGKMKTFSSYPQYPTCKLYLVPRPQR